MINKKIALLLLFLAVVAGSLFILFSDKAEAPFNHIPEPKESKQEDKTFDKNKYSTEKPDSLWVVVNKKNPLSPVDYQPDDLTTPNVPLRVPGHATMRLRKQAAEALEEMFSTAKSADIQLMLSSGHRDYSYQKNLYESYVAQNGRQEADTFSARPGHSEHQTGLAADVEPTDRECELEECFGDLAEGRWVAKNAHKFGFILTYPKGKDDITGYTYEPWHLRYVGKELANEMQNQSIKTLEEFFNISGGKEY